MFIYNNMKVSTPESYVPGFPQSPLVQFVSKIGVCETPTWPTHHIPHDHSVTPLISFRLFQVKFRGD